MENIRTPVDTLIEKMGGMTKAAMALGLKPSRVGMWKTRDNIPAEYVLDVERLSGVSRHLIRPDVFGPEP